MAGIPHSSQTARARRPGTHISHLDVAYAAPVGRAHLLDVYVPTAGDGPFPTVILQTGSAFFSDDTKSGGPRRPPARGVGGSPSVVPGNGGAPTELGGATTAAGLAALWAPRGYAVVGLNVRSSRQAAFPAQVHDIKAAVRFLRANAPRYGLDTGRFATMGTSSGAWVASMAAMTDGVAGLEGDLGNADQSSGVQALIDLFGPTDFLQMDSHLNPGGRLHDPEGSPESRLMGFAIQTNPSAVARANPISYVTASSPPTFISHGTADTFVPHHQSQIFFAALEEAEATATLALVPGAGHTDRYLANVDRSAGRLVSSTTGGTTATADWPPPTYETLVAFLDEHLGTT